MQLARQAKLKDMSVEVTVLSCDYDFIAIAPPKSVDVLLDPLRKVMVRRADALAVLGVDAQTLFLGYTLGGCDDVSTNIAGVGITQGLNLAKKHQQSTNSAQPLTAASIKKTLHNELRNETFATINLISAEILALYRKLWSGLPDAVDRFENQDGESKMMKFASERFPDGSFCRLLFRERALSVRNNII